jgi:LysM repeat protein
VSDDSELQINNNWSDDRAQNPRRRKADSGNGKPLRIVVVVVLILIFGGGIYYFLSKQSTGGEASPLQAKLTALEEKVAGLERQMAEMQGKMGASDPDLLRKVDVLTQKVETLERGKPTTGESKAKPSAPSKLAASTKRQVHTVQKGESLQTISKKYGVPVEQLRKLNNLPAGQPLHAGQKLIVSTER